MMFLDSSAPLSTCDSSSCEGCPVAGRPVCHFNARQLLIFVSIALPLFLAGGYAPGSYKPLLLIPRVLFIPLYFGFIEIRVMCSHCPPLCGTGPVFTEMLGTYGSPKVWKYRPGPMSLIEKARSAS